MNQNLIDFHNNFVRLCKIHKVAAAFIATENTDETASSTVITGGEKVLCEYLDNCIRKMENIPNPPTSKIQ